MADQISALEIKDITKQFPGVLANDKVSLNLKKGEIHALLGENGAGKTTLMNMVYGLYHPDHGQIFVNGQEAHIKEPTDAINLGIGMVHQHFMLIPVFTVAENIVLGNETIKGLQLDRRAASQRIRELSQQFGLEIDPNAMTGELPVGVQQRVEIIKALYRHCNVLILDEPTAVLTPQEADDLFRIMRELTQRGVSIIFISHKLKEVLAIADRITVLRGGRVVGETTPQTSDEHSLAAMMVGREVLLTVEKEKAQPKEVVLHVEGLRVKDKREHEAVAGVMLEVRAGEVLGIAGVQGNGQTELVEALTGLTHSFGGKMILAGQDVTNATPRRLVDAGIAHVPEDRHQFGMIKSYPIADNMILNTYHQEPYARRRTMNNKAIEEHAKRLVAQYDVRTPSVYTKGEALSGGNQQKMVVAREFSRPIKLLIAAQPTRGLDVGSIEFIHKRIIEQRDAGAAVLLVSAELDEVMSVSDRIAVMYRGKIIATVEAKTATREQLGLLMAGITPEQVAQK
ncbi:Galactose/methyl galactoside import ATP-binding protein MglA [Thermoflexales bacterium]|nr:Galactose/methyl galactoside import ATP-binding protein MglA [Thermoflexales bacterium]